MRTSRVISVIGVAAIIALPTYWQLQANQTKTEAVGDQSPNPKITPVIVLKPGETKELVMSTWCRVGVTRGGGLSVKMMPGGSFDDLKEPNERIIKDWKLAGINVQVPDFAEATKGADLPMYAPLKKKGLSAFVVKVTAAQDAKPGLLNLHLADTTCSGDCHADLRVLVVEPEKSK